MMRNVSGYVGLQHGSLALDPYNQSPKTRYQTSVNTAWDKFREVLLAPWIQDPKARFPNSLILPSSFRILLVFQGCFTVYHIYNILLLIP